MMIDVCNPREVRELLDKYGLAPKKGFGQNFLIQPNVPQRIAEMSRSFAPMDKPAAVLEIGPGVGALTQFLSEYYDRVTAVEIDTGLIPLLAEVFAERENITVVNKDFMTVDLPAFLEEQFGDILAEGGSVSICANLPYYITTPVLMRILESWPASRPVPLAGITVMVQLEVARRICADPGDKDDYGALSAAIGLRADAEKLFDVSPGCFFPVPKVSSAVCGILPHGGLRQIYPDAPADDGECDAFGTAVSDVIGMAFGQRRKTLVNSLSGRFAKDATAAALEEMGLRPDVRGEKLTTEEFCTLTGLLLKK
ncbi:MAG: ribosomal RNA small subunit methyltransferase A [Clostridia bacterium]|nr:ribosomal RNA small subunit methyltransferase A [Clostridia bacterium]MBQ4605477.1 ribosomal RNA small subunit methyltransferase A [Clostridia bacterium]